MTKMDKLGHITSAARHVGTLTHEHVTGLSLSPIPTVIIVSVAVLAGLIALIVRGGQRPRRSAHRA